MVENVDYQPLSISETPNNTQECFLQGSIIDEYVGQLHDRLKGLCDNVPPSPFTDHERNYVMKNIDSAAQIHVTVCKSVGQDHLPYQLKYVGTTGSTNRNKVAMTRSVVTVACNREPDSFLKELGFTLQYETQLHGHLYRKGIIKIKVARLLSKINFDMAKYESASTSFLVEVSAPSNVRDETVSNEIKKFAQSLHPIIHLDKIDPKKMQQAFQ